MQIVNRWHAQDRITYRRRKQIKYLLTFGFEIINFIWFIYGNLLYYEWRGKTEDND